MYPLKIQGVNALSARYRKDYVYVTTASRLVESNFALAPKFDQRWQSRQDTFWWCAIARKEFESKRVVRSWVTRRLRQAFVESLRKKGYASDGSRIEAAGNKPALFGTAQLFPERPILKMRFMDLVEQTDLVVQQIIRRQGRTEKQGFKSLFRGELLNKIRDNTASRKESSRATVTKR